VIVSSISAMAIWSIKRRERTFSILQDCSTPVLQHPNAPLAGFEDEDDDSLPDEACGSIITPTEKSASRLVLRSHTLDPGTPSMSASQARRAPRVARWAKEEARRAPKIGERSRENEAPHE